MATAHAHYHRAHSLYTEAIELNGTNAVFFSNRAFALIRLKRYADACKDAEQAIALDAQYIKGYHRLATALKELGRHKDAMDAVKRGIRADGKTNKKKKAGAASVKELKRLGHEIKGLLKAGVKELSGEDANRKALAEQMAKAVQGEIMQVQEKARNFSMRARGAAMSANAKERLIKQNMLTIQELANTPDANRTFMSVGKAFVLESKAAVTAGLNDENAAYAKEMAGHKKQKMYFEKQAKECGDQLQEIVKRARRG